MGNVDYSETVGVTESETRLECLAAMARYGDNKWWEPDEDPRKCAYYQMCEWAEGGVLLSDFNHFRSSLLLLVGRPILSHELYISADALRQEAERAWTYEIGATSHPERQERVNAFVQHLCQWAEKQGKVGVSIEPPNSE